MDHYQVTGPRFRSRRLYVAGLCTCIVLATGMPSASAPSDDAVTPVTYVLNSVAREPKIDYLGKSATELLPMIMDRLASERIVSGWVGGPPEGFEPTDGSVPAPSDFEVGKWIYFEVSSPTDSGEALRSIWDADLVTGVLRDAMRANGEVLYAAQISLILPDDTVVPNVAGGGGDVVFNQQFPTPSPDDAARSIIEAASSAGLVVESLEIVQLEQPAPALVVTTEDPKGFVDDAQGILNDIFGDPPTYEAYYVEVRDQAGQPVFFQATNFRIGAGHQWVRPDLDPRRAE
jgi:hypothetical protein